MNMAHNVDRSHQVRYHLMWKWLLTTMLIFGLHWGAAFEEDRQSRKAGIPEGCAYLISGLEFLNSSLQTESLAVKRHITNALYLNSATFAGQEGSLMASEHNHRAQFFARSISESGYDEVYFLSGILMLAVADSSRVALDETNSTAKGRAYRPFDMITRIQGVFSNRTGRFCATFCAGPSPEEREHQKGRHRRREFLPLENFVTPAELAYRVEHPKSSNVPNTLQQRDCNIHIELDFPKVMSIFNPLVSGVMMSLRSPDDPLYFHPLNISGTSTAPYNYTDTVQCEAHILAERASSDISSGLHENLKLWRKVPPFCDNIFAYPATYSPVWNSSCSSSKGDLCSPFQNLDISNLVSSYTLIETIQCATDWRIRATFLFEFTQKVSPRSMGNKSNVSSEFRLFAEGFWDFYKGQLVMVAYHLGKDGSPLDARIQITFQIPMVRTLYHRYGIIGHVRSTREESDPLYFLTFSFVGDVALPRPLRHESLRKGEHDIMEIDTWSSFRFSYDYNNNIKSTIQPVCSQAAGSGGKKFHSNARFPDGSTASDLEVPIPVAIPAFPGMVYRPREKPLNILRNVAIGQNFRNGFEESGDGPPSTADVYQIPVSFEILGTQVGYQVFMEGYYDSTTGYLCMLGCRRPWKDVAAPYEQDGMKDIKSLNENCDLVFGIQYPPTNPRLWAKRPFVTGTITSLFDAHHPLYFKPVVFNSSVLTTYHVHRRWTLLRRNLETIMSLATLSLTTFFIAIQVGYSTRQSNFRNLRFVSLVTLAILTSGHFFVLLLSFNSFWTKRPMGEANFLGFSGWPEAQEVIVRGTGLVALLLELRLMQLVWRSRTRANSTPHMVGGNPPPKVSDVSVLLACLPAYATMMIVVGCLHWQLGPHQQQVRYFDARTIQALLWADLQAYSGVIVDLFLFPQVVANVLWDTEKKVVPLYPLFYLGVTTVRCGAHLFDVGRDWNFIPDSHMSYFYANPNWDLYSTTWDIIIPCCSIILATVLFLQQRYGGRCFIPKSSRRQIYERAGSVDAGL